MGLNSTPLMNQLELELGQGERVVWSAQPVPSTFARGSIFLVLFGVVWTAFSVFWVVMASAGVSKGPKIALLFPLFGVPFVLIGIGMLTSPIWMRKSAGRTLYAITDRRALIVSRSVFGRTTVNSFEPARLGSTEHAYNPDGSGDIIFDSSTWVDSDGDRRSRRVGFLGVPEVRQVIPLIQNLAQQGNSAK